MITRTRVWAIGCFFALSVVGTDDMCWSSDQDSRRAQPSTFRSLLQKGQWATVNSISRGNEVTGEYWVRVFSKEQKQLYATLSAEYRERRDEYERKRDALIEEARGDAGNARREELRKELAELQNDYQDGLRPKIERDIRDGSFYEIVDVGRDYVGFRRDGEELFLRTSSILRIRRIVELDGQGRESQRPGQAAMLIVYEVRQADPEMVLQVLQTLLAGTPGLRLALDPKTNRIVVFARRAEHATVAELIEKLDGD